MENTGRGTNAAREIQIWEDREFLGYSVAVVGEWEARLLRWGGFVFFVFFPRFVIHLLPAAWAVLVGRIAVVPTN
jgi:hypothetical protein